MHRCFPLSRFQLKNIILYLLISSAIFLPFLYGCNADTPVPAGFFGLSGSEGEADMLRAVFEGVAYSHRSHIEKLLAYRTRPKAIRMAGGAVRSRVWRQMFADVLNMPVEIVDTVELGAKGCALAAAVAVGVYPDYASAAAAMVRPSATILPDPEKVPVYERKYQAYRALIARLV